MNETAGSATPPPVAPIEGEDAGPADEYWVQQKREAISSAHARAAALVEASCLAMQSSIEAAEDLARQALRSAAEAYWIAECTDGAQPEHMYLHEVGRWTRETFGCVLGWNGAYFTSKCPVKIADERWGMSTGFTAKRWCSICYEDLSECAHQPERLYWVTGGPTAAGACRVCSSNDCVHDPAKFYAAPAISIVKEADVAEISFVDVPAQPLARATEVVIKTSSISRAVRNAFPQARANCDHCTRPYHGLPKPKDWTSGALNEVLMAPTDMRY